MTQLDTRSRDVLMILLQTSTPITVRQIADQLDITPRMMRKSLNTIQDWLEERGAGLIRKTNYGIQIRAGSEQRNQFRTELNSKKAYLLYLSPAERTDILVLMLLRGRPQPLLPEDIEPVLGISRPTLLKDIEKAQKWLDTFALRVSYKPRTGFQLDGSETSWREAMVHFYIAKYGVISLLSLGDNPVSSPEVLTGSNLLNTMLAETLRELDLASAYACVKKVEEGLRRRFIDTAFVRLACHLALAVARSANGQSVMLLEHAVDGASVDDEARIVQQSLQEAPFGLNSAEIDYFTHQVRGAKIQYSLVDMLQSSHVQTEQMETQEIVQHIVDEASLFLHPYLKVDQQLVHALMMHIQVVKNRLRYNLPIDNPLQEAVEAQYPHIVNVARESLSYLAEKINRQVPAEEVAYIAMHLGAAMERLRPLIGRKWKIWIICGEGTATAWLLMARLQAEFQNIEVLEVTSVLEFSKNPPRPGQVDLVLTTLPFDAPHVPCLEVSPLLTREDRSRILAVFNQSGPHKEPEHAVPPGAGPLLSSLLREETIALGMSLENWEGVVEVAGELLRSVGAIQSRYIQAMKEVIYHHGPYVVFAPGVALLHARPEDGVNAICMSLVTLDPPVPFHHPHNDPVRLAIGLCVVDNQSHLKALAQLANLLSDGQRLSRIKAAKTKAEVLELLAHED